MSIYILVFVISSGLIGLGERKKSKKHQYFYFGVAIVVPVLLAALRSPDVGTDIQVYLINNFNVARNSASLSMYYTRYVASLLSEPLYHILIYLVSRFTADFHFCMFVVALLINVSALIGFCRLKRMYGTPAWLGMLIYYLFTYNISLNIMRQMLAVSFVFLSVTYMLEKKYKKYVFFLIVAIGFHATGIIDFAFLPMYLILKQGCNISVKKQIIQVCIFIAALFTLLAIGQRMVFFLVSKGIFRINYLKYLSGGMYYSSSEISFLSVSMFMVFCILFLLHHKHLRMRKTEGLFFSMMSFLLCLSMLGSAIATYVSRLGYYFMPLVAVGLCNIYQCYSKSSKKAFAFGIVMYCLFIWFIIFVYRGNHETVPYVSDVLSFIF